MSLLKKLSTGIATGITSTALSLLPAPDTSAEEIYIEKHAHYTVTFAEKPKTSRPSTCVPRTCRPKTCTPRTQTSRSSQIVHIRDAPTYAHHTHAPVYPIIMHPVFVPKPVFAATYGSYFRPSPCFVNPHFFRSAPGFYPYHHHRPSISKKVVIINEKKGITKVKTFRKHW